MLAIWAQNKRFSIYIKLNIYEPSLSGGSLHKEVIGLYISDKQFTYDGFPSYVYGLRFAWIERSPDTVMTSTKTHSFIKNRANNTFSISKSDYEDPLEFDAEIVSDKVLMESEVREIYRHFFDKNQFKELKVETDNGNNIHFNCIITSPERTEGGIDDSYGVVGFKVKIICDAPWGWTDEIVISPDLSYESFEGNSDVKYAKFCIYNYSDSQDYIYPTLSFTVLPINECSQTTRIGSESSCIACNYKEICQSAGISKAMIINNTDSETRGTCVIASDNEIGVVMIPSTGLVKAEGVNFISNTNKKFFRLLPGKNEIYVENISKIEISYREARVLV